MAVYTYRLIISRDGDIKFVVRCYRSETELRIYSEIYSEYSCVDQYLHY